MDSNKYERCVKDASYINRIGYLFCVRCRSVSDLEIRSKVDRAEVMARLKMRKVLEL